MAGIYLHIPFCRQACHYCDFHFSTSMRLKEELLAALHRELDIQRHFLQGQEVKTIYFGGGTPSLLTEAELMALFDTMHRLYPVAADAEITLEANPDDLTPAYLQALRRTPVNRLSIGIQSFSEADLRFMNRAHSAQEAEDCLRHAATAGFDDLTIDLIYGSPTTSHAQWQHNLQTALSFGVPHLSCYSLTVEQGTALGHFVAQGKVPPLDEAKAAHQMEMLMDTMEAHGYEHYETSNFALPGRHSRHNTHYWMGHPYLGIGPSAHSFDGQHRQWNVSHNPRYIQALAEGHIPCEREALSPTDRYNECVLTGLRTKWGVNTGQIRAIGELFAIHFTAAMRPFLTQGLVQAHQDTYTLTRQGKLLADHITSELFWVDGQVEG